MAVGDVKKLNIIYNLFEQQVQNSLYIRFRTVSANVTEMVEEWQGTLVASDLKFAIMTPYSPQLVLDTYTVEDVVPGTAPRQVFAPGGASTDNEGQSAAGTCDVSANSASLGWITNYRGQNQRGRWFVMGIPKDTCSNGRLSDDQRAAILIEGQSIVDHYAASADYELVLFRKVLSNPAATPVSFGGAEPYKNPIIGHSNHKPLYDPALAPVSHPPYNPLAFTTITGTQVASNILRTQRRREIDRHITRFHRV